MRYIQHHDEQVKILKACHTDPTAGHLGVKKTLNRRRSVPVKMPWYHVGIDFIGPIKKTINGNCYILTLSDYCSKWVEAVATPTKCASVVASALFKVHMYILCTYPPI